MCVASQLTVFMKDGAQFPCNFDDRLGAFVEIERLHKALEENSGKQWMRLRLTSSITVLVRTSDIKFLEARLL